MKLHAGDASALDDRSELLAVRGDGDSISRERRDVAMCEVHLGARRDSRRDRSVAHERHVVPADVRDLQVRLPPIRNFEVRL